MWAIFASPIARKVMLYGAIILAVLYAVRWYSNREWSKGYDEGKTSGIAEIEKAKAAEWASREADLRKATAVADEKLTQADAILKQARQVQSDAKRVLDSTISQSEGRMQGVHEAAVSIPPDRIDDAILRLSADLGPPRVDAGK